MYNTNIPNKLIPLKHSHIEQCKSQNWNLSTTELIEVAIQRNEGKFSVTGAFCAETGKFTGRAAKDKYTVVYSDLENEIWYGDHNKKMSSEIADKIFLAIQKHYATKDLFIRDCHAGADVNNRVNVRLITERAWHNFFGLNMFITPLAKDLESLSIDFTIYHAPTLTFMPAEYELRSEACVVIDLKKKRVMICGTEYAGEIKKSVFSIMNYLLPKKGVLSMHCSANVGKNKDTAIFFGLSGTGKTTLSSDPNRALIGDDEHGWSDNGVFNIEGGCYAKMIKLSPQAEPEIYAVTKKFGTILENIVMNPTTREVDFDDDSITENTRGSYPLSLLDNIYSEPVAGHPTKIIMLTADAFGVLPPVSKLSKEQAMYHFISGYTAKLAGTEAGVMQPTATFSACFGAAFMTLKPMMYAKLLGEKIIKHNASVYLVNTGWTGGEYGVGHRMPIKETRMIINGILDGSFDKLKWIKESYFNLDIPESCPGIDASMLQPSKAWKDINKYKEATINLINMFKVNFKKYESEVSEQVIKAGF